jgi:hypothetical protein
MRGTVIQKHTAESRAQGIELPCFTAGIFALLFVLGGAAAHETRPQAGVIDEITRRIDVRDNAAVFSLLVMLNAAGYDYGADAPMHAVRRSVRGALPRMVPDTTFEKIEAYYAAHATGGLATYIAPVIATSGPPNFTPTFAWDDDVANRAAYREHAQLPALLRSFTRSIRFDSIFRAQQTAHLAYSVEYTPVVRREAASALRYARISSRAELYRVGERGRTIIIPNLLMARGTAVARTIDTTTYIVEGPQNFSDFEPREFIRAVTHRLTHDAKHATLHRRGATAFDAAKGRPGVPPRMSLEDYVGENLISAIALRHREDRRDSPGAQMVMMERVREGFLLVPFFVEQLSRYESQSDPLRVFYPRLFEQLDGARELARWRDSIR